MPRWARFGVVLVVAMVAAACSSKEEPKETLAIVTTPGKVPDEEFQDFVTQESDSGRVEWRLMAPKADRYIKRKLVLLDKPTIEFFDKQGKLRTTLVAETGEYAEESRNMLARGNVVVRTIDGDVLETDSLLWDNAREKILSDAFVRLTRQDDIVTGWGLEADPDMDSVDIKRDVEAHIREEEGQGVSG